MAVGIQPSIAQLNAQAGQLALAIRNDQQSVLNFNAYLEAIGGAPQLEVMGMTNTDANTMISTFGNLAVVATAYQGQGLIAATFNYMANSTPFWGGQ